MAVPGPGMALKLAGLHDRAGRSWSGTGMVRPVLPGIPPSSGAMPS